MAAARTAVWTTVAAVAAVGTVSAVSGMAVLTGDGDQGLPPHPASILAAGLQCLIDMVWSLRGCAHEHDGAAGEGPFSTTTRALISCGGPTPR
jgi:hypothetical protein